MITGWLIDIDHLLDFTIALKSDKLTESWQASIKKGSYFKNNDKVIVLLHSWELIGLWILIWMIVDNWEIGVVGGLAWIIHLLIDHFSYKLNVYTYFFSYRIYHNFAMSAVCKD